MGAYPFTSTVHYRYVACSDVVEIAVIFLEATVIIIMLLWFFCSGAKEKEVLLVTDL
jgi:hypothetical protein